MRNRLRYFYFYGWLLVLSLCACRPLQAELPLATPTPSLPPTQPPTIEPEGFTQRIHDPVIAVEGDTYYVFSTGSRLIMICSKDKITWEWCGRIFEETPRWMLDINREIGDLWAPDITFYNGKWYLYYAGSSFGSQNSVIGLATNVTLDRNSPNYKWVDEGEVIRSRIGDSWNAIDPNFALDEADQPWLAFGSYWTGIKMRKLDPATGKLATDDTTLYSLANRRAGPDHTDAIEAAFITHRKDSSGDFYYLFASFDACCRGADSTYNVRVGRSEAITGPYVDREGVPMLKGGGTMLLQAYDRWRGPGHNGLLIEDGTYWLVYHAYDALQVGIPKLRIEALQWDAEGWPWLASQTKSQ